MMTALRSTEEHRTAPLWRFCLRSLWTEYGLGFLAQVALAHPISAWRGLRRYQRERLRCTREELSVEDTVGGFPGGARSIVGVGFCLKPIHPTCPAGRANHECWLLDGRVDGSDACSACAVRSLAVAARGAGSAFYVMTSARDILHDLLLPSLRKRTYTPALLVLCRYSFEPFRFALAVCGVEPRMVALESGDCRDFAAWRRADRGDKAEQTSLGSPVLNAVIAALASPHEGANARRFRRAGNVFVVEEG